MSGGDGHARAHGGGSRDGDVVTMSLADDASTRRALPVPPSILFAALVRRPAAAPALLRAAMALARPGWWRRWPPLPVPSAELWALRMEVATGDRRGMPTADELVDVARWATAMRRWGRC
jgi:hypothetical protein